jgi:hypothetical protein
MGKRMQSIRKREFIAAAFGMGAIMGSGPAWAQAAGQWINQHDGTKPPPGALNIKRRKARTTKLFLSPPYGTAADARQNNQKTTFPNALAIMTDPPGGLWIGEQKLSGPIAKLYPGLPDPQDLTERAWLVDWNGKVLREVHTPRCRNTGGMAYGNGCLWRSTEYPGVGNEGIYQYDLTGKLVSFHQMPLGLRDGGGSHGAMWVDGKLWLVSNRLRGIVRVDPKTWIPDLYIPEPPEYQRFHACAWDNGTIWQVCGNISMNPLENQAHLIRYDIETGNVIEIVDFLPGSADPHGLTIHKGQLISCDAGNHPNWPIYRSPTSGWVFRIDFV